MYDPQTGRFISRDTYGGSKRRPQTQNRYAYVGNNPVTFVDPTGHCGDACAWLSDPAEVARRIAQIASVPMKLLTGQWVSPSNATTSSGASTSGTNSPATSQLSVQGVQASAQGSFMGGYVTASVAIVATPSGEVGATASWGGGGTTSVIGLSVGAGPVISNATYVSDYDGRFGVVGGSCAGGLGIAANVAFGTTSDGRDVEVFTPELTFSSEVVSFEGIIPLPCEAHAGVTDTTYSILVP
jgi:uncharacterized protein RhaS with RHS repeats